MTPVSTAHPAAPTTTPEPGNDQPIVIHADEARRRKAAELALEAERRAYVDGLPHTD